jgi:galactokinase
VEAVRAAIAARYRTPAGGAADVYVCTAAAGAEVFAWTG